MMPPNRHDAARDPRISIEKGALRSRRDRRRFPPQLEAGPSIQGIGGRGLNIPAHTKVESQAREDSEIILKEQPGAPSVRVAGYWGVLRDRRRETHHEIRERWNPNRLARRGILYIRGIEAEYAVVVQQGLLNVLVESFVTSKRNRMSAAGIVDHVPRGIKVRAGDGPGDGACCCKEARHGDLR